jgi:type IV secretory pathway VirB2 component (pilin)
MLNFRVTKLAALAAAMMMIAFVATSAHAATMRDLAPADEYFGQLRMSVLGIRNELNGLERRAAGGDRNVAAMSGKLALVDDAMRDWRTRYPRDTWLPRFEAQRARVASLIALDASHAGRGAPVADSVVRLLGTITHR